MMTASMAIANTEIMTANMATGNTKIITANTKITTANTKITTANMATVLTIPRHIGHLVGLNMTIGEEMEGKKEIVHDMTSLTRGKDRPKRKGSVRVMTVAVQMIKLNNPTKRIMVLTANVEENKSLIENKLNQKR